MSDSRTLVRNMSRSQPRFNLAGLHSNQALTLQVYAFNNKGRSEAVIVRERIIITAEIGSQSTGKFLYLLLMNSDNYFRTTPKSGYEGTAVLCDRRGGVGLSLDHIPVSYLVLETSGEPGFIVT